MSDRSLRVLIIFGGIVFVILLLALVGKYIFAAIGMGFYIAIHGTIGAGIAISSMVVTFESVSISLLAVATTVYTFQVVVEKASDSKYKYDAFVPILSTLGGIFTALGKDAYQGVFQGTAVLLLVGAFALVYAMAGIVIKKEGVTSKVAAFILYVLPPAGLLGYALRQSHQRLSFASLGSLSPSIQISASLLILLTIAGLLLAYKAGKPE